MAYDYDVHYTPSQDIAHGPAISRLHFKFDETFEKPMVDIEKFRDEMQSNKYTKRIMNRFRTGNWKRCIRMEKNFMNV